MNKRAYLEGLKVESLAPESGNGNQIVNNERQVEETIDAVEEFQNRDNSREDIAAIVRQMCLNKGEKYDE